MNRYPLPLLFLGAWVALIGVLVWGAAQTAVEPPVWDSLSYFVKGLNFWRAVDLGEPFNPFNLDPSMRPPATILMSHPFGFAGTYHGFYFRSVFIPVLLLAAAILTAAPERRLDSATAVLGVALTSMPMLYQFQANDLVPWDVNWGMVDNFMAGMAAVSAAAVLRSVRRQSTAWAAVAAFTAALCFLIKPSGLMVMGLTGMAWAALVLWQHRSNVANLWFNITTRTYVASALLCALAMYGVTILLAFTSDYFSAANVQFGSRVIAVLADEIKIGATFADTISLIRISLGFVLTGLIVAGLCAAALQRDYMTAAISLITAAAGIWFWFFATEPWEPRYFVPFGIMAFIFVTPPLLAALNRMTLQVRRAVGVIVIAPGLLTAVLLATPSPSLDLQRILGVNLITDLFKEEINQAHALLNQLQIDGAARATVYFFNISAPQRSFQAAVGYANLIDPNTPRISLASPIDWQRPNAFRLEDMVRANFLAFEPVTDEAVRNRILAQRNVPDFYAEERLMAAWATTLGESDGVQIVSETQVRVLKLTSTRAFETAFNTLIGQHDWPDSFIQGNQPRWWSRDDLAVQLAARGMKTEPIAFGATEAASPATIHGVVFQPPSPLHDVDVWVQSDLDKGWVLFGHVVDKDGQILLNAQVDLIDHSQQDTGHNIRRYTLSYSDWPATAAGVALGFFKPQAKDLEFLHAQSGVRDWDNRRLVVTRSAR
jgi:hypothetical protein